MEHELLVLALGYHYDDSLQSEGSIEGGDSVSKLAALLPLGEQNRVGRTADLARKYGRILAWARRERHLGRSATRRILASRLDQVLTGQIVKASKLKNVGVNDIYVILWELETMVERIGQTLLGSMNSNWSGSIGDSSDLTGTGSFITHLLQESVTLDSAKSVPLTMAKFHLFKDWMQLQRNLLVSWLCYTKLPSSAEDFWIEEAGTVSKDEANSHNLEERSVWKEYRVVLDRLPALMMTESMAQKILFVGVAMKVLELAGRKTKEHELWLQSALASVFQQDSGQRETGGFRTFFGLWNALEATVKINEMEKWVASALHSLILVEHHLLSHLHVLRDFFFLQDGFFFRTFFSLSAHLMALPPGTNAEHDLNLFFQESAAAKQFLGEDTKSKLFQNLRLTFSPSYKSTSDNTERIWSNLCLDYETAWPINLILSPSTIRQYNDIFQFLFQVKRLQIGLQNSWQYLKHSTLSPLFTHRFQMLRNQMGFFFDTLSQYLHVEVFSSAILSLDEALTRGTDFEALRSAHQEFLNQVSLQCFLTVPAFKRTFSQLFDIVNSFSGLVVTAFGTSSDAASSSSIGSTPATVTGLQDRYTVDLENSMKEWFKLTSLLITLLSGVKGQAPHMHYLLLLLDYSGFWSNGKSLFDLELEYQAEETSHFRTAHFRNPDTQTRGLRRSSSANLVPTQSQTTLRHAEGTASTSDAAKAVRHPKLSTAKRTRAASTDAKPASTSTISVQSSGPRPELLARLMRKTNK